MATATDALWNDPSFWSEPAEQAFTKARRRARREAATDRLRGRKSNLVPFDEVKAGLSPESSENRRAVPLARIVGSLDKGSFFTRTFLPKSSTLVARWKTAFAVAHGLRGYEPVELYEVAGRFFVVDGHSRVSVARVLGFDTIQARVRRWN